MTYMNQIAEEVPDSNMLVFINEAVRDKCTLSRRYGCSHQGLCCIAQRCFIHGTHYSILPALTLNGIIAYDIVEGLHQGTCDFVKFLKEQVMPFTNPYPSPHSVLVMDNCHIHRGDEIWHIVKEGNHKLYPF
ncbi:hypothetical protein PISMIDRAFT_98105 [Pisolithus microcarpus 441]|uniref:Tc1-like transposase DDE domain-containing protein n=1 Tax=Pisolithus microcarpus 441 TaxID=765257 RepID=A0A0C9ZY54_9AGAM|nr:hypothetical protein PISMIDRAFT_98105 [Pisolithus microcarpus 441]